MQPMDNDHERLSFQSRQSAATGFKEFNYVGLTLAELHSPSSVNHEEVLHLMLNPEMSRIPCHPGELSHQGFHDRQGLPVQEGIRHLYQAQHQQHHGLVESACPSQQLAPRYSTPSDHMLEWKDTESMDDDCSIPISWMNGLLADPVAYRELEEQVQNSNQTFSDETEPHLFAAPHATTQSHGWLKNAMGDSVARASNSKNQSDLDIFGHGRLQLIPHSDTYTFASKIFGSFNRPHDHSTPGPDMSSCPNRRVINSNFGPTERTSHFGAAEYQFPSTHATLLRSNSVPAPETLISHEEMLAMHAQPNMNLQLKFGGHGEVQLLQGARATSPVQRLSYLQMGSESLLHKQDDDSRSSGSVEHLNTHFGSSMPLDPDMRRRCSNAPLDSLPVESIIKLRPLDLATVLGASGRDVPNLHLRNGDGHDKNSEEDLTSEHAAMPVPAFMSNVPSVSKLNSSIAPSTSNVERLQSSKTDKLEAQSLIPPKKKKTAPRRSRFDPHDTPCTFVTERIRREKLTEKYNNLKSLIPRSTKVDRASIIEETIAHVQSLKCQIIHLEKVKQEKSINMKRQKLDAAAAGEGRDGLVSEQSGDVKCLWLKRTSRRGTEVDMRILQDEILVSIVQKHLPSFLLRMVTALESKLKLDIMNATGSLIDGFDVYNFRVKITGNSCGVGNEIMTNIIDALDSAF